MSEAEIKKKVRERFLAGGASEEEWLLIEQSIEGLINALCQSVDETINAGMQRHGPIIEAAVAEEREACAREAEKFNKRDAMHPASADFTKRCIAAFIRARGRS